VGFVCEGKINWPRRFIQRHPVLKLAKPSGLDPKRASNSNEPTIKHYFQLRVELEDEYNGIPPEHQWNMDEKGTGPVQSAPIPQSLHHLISVITSHNPCLRKPTDMAQPAVPHSQSYSLI